MAVHHKPEPSEPEQPESKAVDAFEEYKRRIAAAAAPAAPGLWAGQPWQAPQPGGRARWEWPPAPVMAGGPAAAPSYGGPPGWGYPPMAGPGMAPGWRAAQTPGGPPAPGPSAAGCRPSLTQSLGDLLRVSVELANAGLAGGVKMIESLTGMAERGYQRAWPDFAYGEERDCCGCDECCCDDWGGHRGCEPGVHNCC